MKNNVITFLLIFVSLNSFSQLEEKNKAEYDFGNGINFSFNEGKYQFNIYGFIKPTYIYSDEKRFSSEGQFSDVYRQFKSQNSNLFFSGKALDEKLSFVIQMDYSSTDPLVEAFIGYHFNEKTALYFGQMQVSHNNLEMVHNEDQLRFTDRGMISQVFSGAGEEFGLFLESSFGNSFVIEPKIAITSGDGINSFGEDSRDSDKGGVKLGSRINFYPFGHFAQGNQLTTVDLEGEEKLKAQLGFAFSKNFGASNLVGDGHGDFILYDSIGNEQYPDYSQLFFDLNLKYRGFSFVFEYADATASALEYIFTDPNGFNILNPTQISEYLILGDSQGIQFGYFTKNGLSFDFIYEQFNPEFDSNLNSILRESTNLGVGVSKYIVENKLKLQASAFKTNYKNSVAGLDDDEFMSAAFLVQIAF